MTAARDRLIVALDVPTVEDARSLIDRLGDSVSFYKIGHELLFSDGGVRLARELADAGRNVFFDAKLLDIGNTVEKSVRNIAKIGASFLTVHVTDRKTLDAAVRGRGGSGLKLLGVTVMTNLDGDDLTDQGIAGHTPADLVRHRAQMAHAAGFDGVIASAQEAADVRSATDDNFLVVTPGIRPAGSDAGDQSRVMTPAKAIAAGATHLVVGRPITQADDPAAAARAIAHEIAAAATA
ncbi:MAG: orotidine-5'-phosphate decarboxylase [Pseudomonadota bacterium]